MGAVATSINLYGKFNCTTYAITYMYEKEGEIINTNPTTFNVDSVITLVNPTLLGYTFNGWYMGTNLTTTIYNTAQNITLTGKFTATNYSITYMDGGTEITSSTNASAYSVENNATFTAYDKVGYEFVRWINKGQTILNTNSKTGDLVLYSEYTPITYTITYSFNNSVGTPNNNNISSYNIITNYNLRDASVKGYNFVGWFIGNTQINTITNMYDNIEIVGKFAVITYTITYTMDDGVVNTNPLTYTIEDEDFALVNATFGTREFLGWREANRVITTIDTNRAENITLAAWFYTADESNTTTTNANLTTILIAVGAGVMLITIMSLSIIISKLRQHQKVDAERILKLLNQLNKTDQEIMSTKQNNNNNSNQRRN